MTIHILLSFFTCECLRHQRSCKLFLKEQNLRLYIHIPQQMGSAFPCYSSFSNLTQWSSSFLKSHVPHRCACQVGKKLEVPLSGTVPWMCQTCLPSKAGYCEEWAEQGLKFGMLFDHLTFKKKKKNQYGILIFLFPSYTWIKKYF